MGKVPANGHELYDDNPDYGNNDWANSIPTGSGVEGCMSDRVTDIFEEGTTDVELVEVLIDGSIIHGADTVTMQ